VNDAGGHNAGDQLLIDAAKALGEAFAPSQIFRAGGDEFVVIAPDVTEEKLAAKVAAVREAAKHYDNVSFAIGTCVEADGTDIRRALQVADARMYENKRAYYQEHPRQRRSGAKDEFQDQAE